ncbi:MAG: hypothetical protein ABIL06_00880 [Pseudomonadota bacterium]
MKDEKLKEILEILSEIAENHVTIESPACQRSLFDTQEEEPNPKASLSAKLDVIERALEMLRIEKRQLNNKLAFSDFIQGNLEFKNNQIHFTPPLKPRTGGFGTRPVYLQPKLLIYLLFRHGKSDNQVYDIINNFVSVITWQKCGMRDVDEIMRIIRSDSKA